MNGRSSEWLKFGSLVVVDKGFESGIIPATNQGVIIRLHPGIGGVIVLPSFNTTDGSPALASYDREIRASGISAVVDVLLEEEILARLEKGIAYSLSRPVDNATMNAFLKERMMNFGSRSDQILWSPPHVENLSPIRRGVNRLIEIIFKP